MKAPLIGLLALPILVCCDQGSGSAGTSDRDSDSANQLSLLAPDDQKVVTQFLAVHRNLDPAWTELDRRANEAKEPNEFAAALDEFTAQFRAWLPEYMLAHEALQKVQGLASVEDYIVGEMTKVPPDRNRIGEEVGQVRKKFSDDPAVATALREFVLTVGNLPGIKN